MKIVLIAGFSNQEIRSHLELKKNGLLFTCLLKWFKLPARVGELRDFAGWVVNMISDLEKNNDIELHVIGPHVRLKQSVEEFQMRGVYYHFFTQEWTSMGRLVGNYKIWKRIQRSTYYTKRLLDKIVPDLVILSGAENPAISVSVFAARKYPCVCLCQTVYNDFYNGVLLNRNMLIQEMEKDIFCQLKYVGVYCRKHYDLLKKLGYKGNILKFNYPPKDSFIEPTPSVKEFDFVNFAHNHSAMKGTHDSIKALAIVRRHYPNVTLNIVGGCSDSLRYELEQQIKSMDLEDNVIFTPFFEKQSDLLKHVQKSRYAVLPCKLDNTSGTMSQSMLLHIPIIVYETPGTLAFNVERKCALVAKMDDVNKLAEYMMELMSSPQLVEELKVNGRWYKENKAQTDKKNWERFVRAIPHIVESCRGESSLPEEFLFNPETDY